MGRREYEVSFEIPLEEPSGNVKYAVGYRGLEFREAFCSYLCGLLVHFEDLNMPDTVLGSGNVKTNKMFIQYLLNTYRCCVMGIALWELPSQEDKSVTKSRTV